MKLSPKIPVGYLAMGLFRKIQEYFVNNFLLLITIILLNIWIKLLTFLSKIVFFADFLNKTKNTAIYQRQKLQKILRKVEKIIEIAKDSEESFSLKRDNYLSALVQIQKFLLTLNDELNCYSKILRILGEISNSSRVYIFKVARNEISQLIIDKLVEWRNNEFNRQNNNLELPNIFNEIFFSRWKNLLQQNEIVVGMSSDFPASERAVLEARGILSILVLPIIVKGNLFGFIGFEHDEEKHYWQRSEVDFLRVTATAICLAEERRQAEEGFNRLATILDATTDFVGTADRQRRTLYINQAGRRFLGIDIQEDISNLASTNFYPQWAKKIILEEGIPSAISNGVWSGEIAIFNSDGQEVPIEQLIIAHKSKDGKIDCFSTIGRDISESKQAEQKIRELNTKLEFLIQERTFELRKTLSTLQSEVAERKRAEQELESLLSLQNATLEATVDGILAIDRNGSITSYNQKFIQMWHIPKNIAATLNRETALYFLVDQIKNPDDFMARIEEINAQADAEYCDILEFKDGRIFERYCQPQRIGEEIVGRVWIFRDITERQMAENTIRYQALHDLLTDLPNRILFNERLSHALTEAYENQGMLAVMFLDLDRFKTINDTLGHAFGDQLLQVVAERLTGCLWQHDTVARWGGDEFTLLLPQIRCAEDAERIAQRILSTLKQPIDMGDRHLHISGSIGIACYPQDGEDAETLLRNADVALYRAKEEGRHNYQFYRETMNSQASELLTLENELHQALEKGEFVVHYQPQVSTTTGKITQMEALVRWRHSELGLISPAKFIPLAEENGLIVPIGEWVLRTACAQTKAWQDAGLTPLTIAVNLSARQFQQPNLLEMVERILAETGLEPHFLELEITESVAMQDVEFSREILRSLHNMGVLISMDDFGTGYSSLSYLKKFPLHKLKIDQSFVRDLTTDPNDAAIINAIAALGKELNLEMVAEGVETEEQKNILLSLQCEYMQGYLFSRPLSSEDATRFLQQCLENIINNGCNCCTLSCHKG